MSSFAGLLVGLGNPGPKYERTRHNLGFLFVDRLLAETQHDRRTVSELPGAKFRCLMWKAELPGNQTWLVAKPQTFMNLSGESVQPLAAWHRLEPAQIVVVHDELDLPLGRMRFKIGGGNAGHNGLASITQRLGTPDFYRLRLGIGRPPHEMGETINWVLGHFNAEEQAAYPDVLKAAVRVMYDFALDGQAKAVRSANSFGQPPKPEKTATSTAKPPAQDA